MIEVRGVDVHIRDTKILEDVNVDIEKGKLTSIIGPNGAGKSTFLSLISRLIELESGSVHIDGDALFKVPTNELAKRLSILKQANHTELNITVEQLVQFGRFPYSKGYLKDDDHQEVDCALNLLHLDEIRHRNIKTLSGGQKQRAYIAMTIAQNTDYILLDEPLNNLDMKHSVQIMQTLKNLAEYLNKTIIIVIHDINFASCYSDNIIAFKKGRIVHEGTKDDVIDSKILSEIYEMDVSIQTISNQKFCMYFEDKQSS